MDTRYEQEWKGDHAAAMRAASLQKLARDKPMRASVRFPMDLAIRVRTGQGEVEARTVDVSANGVLFEGGSLPDVDSRIEFTMTMPGAIMGHPHDLVVYCTGRIVRRERRMAGDLAAAVIDEYVLKA